MRTFVRVMFPLLVVVAIAMPVLSDTTATGKALTSRELRGQKAYLEYCAMCHGDQGAGNGSMAAQIQTKYGLKVPHLEDRARLVEIGGRKKIEEIIRKGGAHTGRSEVMPAWGERLGSDLVRDLADYVMILPDAMRGIPAATVRAYLQAPPGTPEDGRRLYVHHCAACHGPAGKGDGSMAKSLWQRDKVKPRDLTDAKYFSTRKDSDIYAVISLGGGHMGKAKFMPHWSGYLSPDQIKDLVSYIRSISNTASQP